MRYLSLLESTIPESAKNLSRSKHKYKDKEAVYDWKSPSAKLNAKEHAEFVKDAEARNGL